MRTSKALMLGTALIVGAWGLAGCSSSSESGATTATTTQAPASELTKILASHELDGLDAAEIIDTLDQMPLAERPTDLLASVGPNELTLAAPSGAQTTMPLPADQFYLSFAPFIDQNHDCYFHSLTTCTSELGNKEFSVTITDTGTGRTIVDGTLTSFDNGFIGVWLPKGIEAELTVQYEGKSATQVVSTENDDDATCLTTLQLS